jgi:uncharacterized protein
VRVPGWCSSTPVFSLNGTSLHGVGAQDGYAIHERAWKAGDTLTMVLPMPAQLIAGHPNVEQVRNQVAVMRGPVVYCVESVDLPTGIHVPDVYVPSGSLFQTLNGMSHTTAPLGGTITILRGQGLHRSESPWTGLYRPIGQVNLEPFELRLIPYFAWANRGRSAMSVWMPVVLRSQ